MRLTLEGNEAAHKSIGYPPTQAGSVFYDHLFAEKTLNEGGRNRNGCLPSAEVAQVNVFG